MLFAHLGRQLRTSTFRLTLVIAGLFAVCVAVLFATIDWYAMGTLQTELRTTISARLAAIMENHTQSDVAMLIRNVKEVLEEDPGAYVLLLAPDGRQLAGNMTASSRLLGWTSLRVPSTRPRRRLSSASCYCPRRTTARRWLPTGRSGCVFTGRSTRTDCSSLRDRRRTDIGSRNCRWLSGKPRNPAPIGNCRSGQPGNHAWRHVAATPDARNRRRI